MNCVILERVTSQAAFSRPTQHAAAAAGTSRFSTIRIIISVCQHEMGKMCQTTAQLNQRYLHTIEKE